MPLQATSGAASYDAFGGGVPVVPEYIEDMFSTYLYTGTGAAQTITNGIDLSGKGGLVWIKRRDASGDNSLTVTGNGFNLSSNLTTDFINEGEPLFNSSGFNLVYGTSYINGSGGKYASWTFRKQKKFFDIVTYTGNGANRTIAHNLGSEPACIIIKSTNRNSTDWAVYHRSLGNTQYIRLNNTGAAATSSTYWNNTTPTSTVFSLGTNADVNNSGGANYVAYLFAHDAGGFGLTGTDNVISCGSFTADGSSNFSVNLGYEPQWILAKQSSGSANNWAIFDNMRGMSNTNVARLIPNSSSGESDFASPFCVPTATGFFSNSGGFFDASQTVIYIAIRRGPMKVPTSGTSVFAPVERAGTGTTTAITGLGFTPDIVIAKATNIVRENVWFDRLRGAGQVLSSVNTSSENADANALISFDMNGVTVGTDTTYYSGINNNNTGQRYGNWFMRRAPSFFDEVCYTGTGSATTVAHNLGVVPEMIIAKSRNSGTYPWGTYHSALGTSQYVRINSTAASDAFALFPSVSSTTFGVSADPYNNGSGLTYVAYLFATCAGVSKIGSYTGTATTLQIDCGFTGGARFVLIKRTDSTGAWYVWDTARGIVSGNDPYLLLNSTAAEVTNTDYIDTYSAGFEISSTAPAAINASGGTFIFLAIA